MTLQAMKTYTATPADINKQWFIIDAEGLVLGRLAVEVAKILRGKHKASYTPHMDCGDNIVIINADKIVLTGKKEQNKKYYWHTGYPGGIKETTAGKILEGEYPDRVLRKAIERMMPKESPLARQQLRNLYIYNGSEHKQEAQKPQPLNLAERNSKNSRKEESEA